MIDRCGLDIDSAFLFQTITERRDLSKQFTYLLIALI